MMTNQERLNLIESLKTQIGQLHQSVDRLHRKLWIIGFVAIGLAIVVIIFML